MKFKDIKPHQFFMMKDERTGKFIKCPFIKVNESKLMGTTFKYNAISICEDRDVYGTYHRLSDNFRCYPVGIEMKMSIKNAKEIEEE